MTRRDSSGHARQMERGEIGIRASLRAQHARAKKPESLNEAVSSKMDENIASRTAEMALQVPEELVAGSGEAIQPNFRSDLPFRNSRFLDTLQNPTMVSVIASEHRLDLAASVDPRVVESAVDAAQSAQAQNSLEKMICHQMAAGHRLAMREISKALNEPLPPVEVARLSNAAARMMQVCQEALLTIHRIRTGGRQTVVVQHVQVSDGGQAVVTGNVNTNPPGRSPVRGV
jgi:hypothetical protein